MSANADRWVAGTFVRLDKRSGKAIGGFDVVETPNVGFTLEDYVKVNLIDWHRRHPHSKITQNHAYSLCNGQRGWLLTFDADYYGERMNVRQVFAVNTSHGYVATYAHIVGRPDFPDGLAALNSLCIPPDEQIPELIGAAFTPPSGWSPVDLTTLTKHFKDLFAARAWFGPLHDLHRSVILLAAFQTPNVTSLSSDDLEAGLQAGMSTFATGAEVVSHDPVSLCGEDGTHYVMTATARGFPMAIDVIVSAGSPRSYAVFYMRRLGDAVEPEAAISIRSLCPKDRQSEG